MRRTFMLTAALLLCNAVSAQEHVLKRLNESPRHHEWVTIKHGERVMHAFVVYPEVKGKATAVLVIHENRGLTDWVRGVTDVSSGELVCGRAANNGKYSTRVGRPGTKVAQFLMVARTATSDRGHKAIQFKRSSCAAIPMMQTADHRNRIYFAAFRQFDEHACHMGNPH